MTLQNTNFEQKIQQWVSLDNQLKIYNEKIRELREKKNELEEGLIEHAQQNNITNSLIQISDGKLKFISSRVQCPLTFKYLEKSLGTIIKDENQVKRIIHHVKEQREIKIVPELKRFYSK